MAKIGIDFGTSYSTVCRINPKTGKAESIRINGEDKIPSILYYSPDGGDPMVGKEAFDMFELCRSIDDIDEVKRHIRGIVSGMKRKMNPDFRKRFADGRELSYVDMIAEFFSFIKQEVEQTVFVDEKVTGVCVTHPVDFADYKKQILVEAAKKAGFKEVKMLMEPIAAAMGYKDNDFDYLNKSILIYDFGGGTFDLAFVKFDGNGDHITLPPMGDEDCGGENIDRILYDAWDGIVYQESRRHIAKNQGEIDLPFLKAVCQRQKEFLSAYFKKLPQYTLRVSIGNVSRQMPMTRELWEDMISNVIDKTIVLTKQMLEVVEREHFTVDKILLIGGSSRFPQVKEELEKLLPGKVQAFEDADIAVAKGAAIFANESAIPKKKCYCRMDGKEMDTSMRCCPNCGTPNFKYDYRFQNVEYSSEVQLQKPVANIERCFCLSCGKQIDTSIEFCSCGAKNIKYKVGLS